MPRIARVVIPRIPHHITQRGNRRQTTFFGDEDYQFYREVLGKWCRRCAVEIWAYCLMPNHVHLIAVPSSEHGLRYSIGEAHKRYTRRVNTREGWKGHLWQGRFFSYPLDEACLLTAVRYIEMNPVRARLVRSPEKYPWSSASAHLTGKDDLLAQVRPLLNMVADWQNFLRLPISDIDRLTLKRHERTGRPLGDDRFIHHLEQILNRDLHRKKTGPKSNKNHELVESSPPIQGL
jgi:putative transposase